MKASRIIRLFAVWVVLATNSIPVFAQETHFASLSEPWQTSSPEAQGMESEPLAAMLRYIATGDLNIHSALVIRNGVLVLEAYRHPYTADTLHQIYSCTKSVMSALIGLALAQGFIEDLDQFMLDYFPDRTIANLSHAKQTVSIEHLLTMSSGLDWPGDVTERTMLRQLATSEDWLQFVLDRPMEDDPGQQFDYNSGGSNLLAAIVEQATGQSLLEFARMHLFAPLGIQSVRWNDDPQGHYLGGWGLALTPRDMAKFGYLYLSQGQWDGKQIIPAAWVATSTQEQIEAQPLSDGYGYQWWVDDQGYFMALGYGGQHIIVHPAENLVVVFTSALSSTSFSQPEALFQNFILSAIQSDDPLPNNPEGAMALEVAVDALANPQPIAVAPVSDTATRISGLTYQLEPNTFGWNSVSFRFAEEANTAQFILDGQQSLTVGLDNLLRVSQLSNQSTLASKGLWRREDRFDLRIEIVGSADWLELGITFEGSEIRIFARESSGMVSNMGGTAQNAFIPHSVW